MPEGCEVPDEHNILAVSDRALPLLKRTARLRIFAGVLAAGGVFWGLFCLPLMIVGVPIRTIPTFGPGYLVTAGYIMRALMASPPSGLAVVLARAMWWLSALVQGAWLSWLILGLIENPYDSTIWTPFGVLILLWWTFAFAVSVYGIFNEPREATAEKPKA